MTSKNPKDQAKARGKAERPKRQSSELETRDLEKVTGGVKRIGDPCDGGEIN